jgi:hypothetical protein
VGVALQGALALLPDPGLGSASSGLPALRATAGSVAGILASNLVTMALITAGALATASTALGRGAARPRRNMIAYLVLLAVAGWLYFSTGVDWLAGTLSLSRAATTARLVHGFLEWPGLLLPWAAVAFAVTPRRTIDLRLVAAGCACSIGLLAGAALLESLLVPQLLAGAYA